MLQTINLAILTKLVTSWPKRSRTATETPINNKIILILHNRTNNFVSEHFVLFHIFWDQKQFGTGESCRIMVCTSFNCYQV